MDTIKEYHPGHGEAGDTVDLDVDVDRINHFKACPASALDGFKVHLQAFAFCLKKNPENPHSGNTRGAETNGGIHPGLPWRVSLIGLPCRSRSHHKTGSSSAQDQTSNMTPFIPTVCPVSLSILYLPSPSYLRRLVTLTSQILRVSSSSRAAT